ncbi:SDR family oxidoreductase [Mycobacterium sp. Y57]|uniref:SDR family NAD(P)-dependent oxidoreductase n=1 Tax=Mycolicibacterium xanthum TaxID=2796469 RepID=UPI001C85253E|nr:SDR family NAD(P)-dependent oxidoreductase [Mycolicibacterium xanthum]MBX7433921.1 SDR family oxidoreductase [Mycolicibacterium xanthum]
MAYQGVLDGKVAVVSGARRGIGKAEAMALAGAGAKVVACDIAYDDLLGVQAEIEAAGGQCLALQCDVREKEQVQEVVDKAVEKFGTVDILVNNAQGALDPVAWEDLTDDIVATSLYSGPVATLRFMQACLPHMKKQGWGRIINTASGAARGGVGNLGHYAMAKGAIASLTYAAATDLSRLGITVNVIYPAVVTDAMKDWMAISDENRRTIESAFPVGYVGDADKDLGPVIVFLASDASGYLTGHPFFIDGGAAYGPR